LSSGRNENIPEEKHYYFIYDFYKEITSFVSKVPMTAQKGSEALNYASLLQRESFFVCDKVSLCNPGNNSPASVSHLLSAEITEVSHLKNNLYFSFLSAFQL
jgi:flagellar motor component MotA